MREPARTLFVAFGGRYETPGLHTASGANLLIAG
jgi:hypothetical protein